MINDFSVNLDGFADRFVFDDFYEHFLYLLWKNLEHLLK